MEKLPVDSEGIGQSKKEEGSTEQNERNLESKEVCNEKVSEKQLQQIGDNEEMLAAKPKEITEKGEIEEKRKPTAKESVSVKGKIYYFICLRYSILIISNVIFIFVIFMGR